MSANSLWATLFVCCVTMAMAAPQSDYDDGFVRVEGINFVEKGKKMYINGFNSYWMMLMASNPADRWRVSSVFREAQSNGLNVARAWAFNDGTSYKPLQVSPGVYDETLFQALDFVVYEAANHNIKLILSLVNNYEDFGGRPQYVRWARASGKSNASSDDDFYTDEITKGMYKNHVMRVLTRVNTFTGKAYKDDPAIFGGELINEPRCPSDPSGQTLQKWVQEMSSFVKTMDPNHLLEVGLEGFYGLTLQTQRLNYNPGGFQYGTDFISSTALSTVDFATVHIYTDQWLNGSDWSVQLSFLQRWVGIHLEDSGKVLKKPVVFAEFGRSYKDSGYSAFQRKQLFQTVYDGVYYAAQVGLVGGGAMFWQLVNSDMTNFADGYDVVLSSNTDLTEIVKNQTQRLAALIR